MELGARTRGRFDLQDVSDLDLRSRCASAHKESTLHHSDNRTVLFLSMQDGIVCKSYFGDDAEAIRGLHSEA